MIDFSTPEQTQAWRAVNDGVMGGKSSGGPTFENNVMRFAGTINTNGGGFSSVRARVGAGSMADASGLLVRVRSDGRQYQMNLRTSATYRFRNIAFRADIPVTPPGEWAEVTVPFSEMQASVFGRAVPGKFDKTDVRQVGIILADGRDGPFQLDVDWIKVCD